MFGTAVQLEQQLRLAFSTSERIFVDMGLNISPADSAESNAAVTLNQEPVDTLGHWSPSVLRADTTPL